MKKLLVIAAVTLASASAFATKARLNALSYPMSRQLTDVQTIFVNPSDLTLMGSWVTFETGTTTADKTPATPPTAEAGFARSVGDARWGFYLGHTGTGITTDTFARGGTQLRQLAAPATYLIEENPMNLFYAAKTADMSWGLGVNYSKSDRGTTLGSQEALGATLGARMGFWDASLDVDITDKASVGANTWTGKTGGDLRVGYVADTMYYYGQYEMAAGDSTNGTASVNLDNNRAALGVVNTVKSDGGEFFYGAALQMTTLKNTGAKEEDLALPVVIGIEADAASWLVLRGSVTQTVLLNSVKTTPVSGTSTDATGGNNTRVAAGTGIKFNKFMLDTTLAAETNGFINGANLLANAGLVYNF
jgi:hypothetical protein